VQPDPGICPGFDREDYVCLMPTTYDDDVRGLCNSLVSSLEKECAIYRELRSALLTEGRVLVKGSTDELFRSIAGKEALATEAETLEEGRMEVVGRIAQLLGMNERDVTLTKLSQAVDESTRNRLQMCQRELTPLIADVKTLNTKNRSLLDSSLILVRDLMNFINTAASSGLGYAGTGQARNVTAGGRLIHREG
jgi:flagellar biosynthesis/type III secretory pathway chaperone